MGVTVTRSEVQPRKAQKPKVFVVDARLAEGLCGSQLLVRAEGSLTCENLFGDPRTDHILTSYP